MAASYLSTTIAEMHRRRVFRVAGLYAIVAWVLLQLGEITFEPLQLPPWSLTALILTVLLGFPVIMALAWVFDWTREGIQRTADTGPASSRRGFLLLAVVLGLDVGLGYYLYTIYAPGVRGEAQTAVGGPAQAVEAPARQVQPPPANSIAVLPFRDFSPEGNQQYFANGITEQLLDELARVGDLKIASLTAGFASQDRDISEIRRLLNVAYVLEGSVRHQGDAVRITAQLIDTRDGFHVWSNTYDRTVNDIFAIQEDIAGSIATALLGVEELARATRNREQTTPSSFEAYNLHLQGREEWRRRTPESLNRAIDLFKQTIELDSTFAPAYAGLADAYLLLANYGNLSRAEAMRLAEPLIQTALELDGQLSEGWASLGLLYWQLGRLSAASAHLRRATELDEGNVVARIWLAGVLGQQGKLGEEAAILGEALEREPLNLLVNLNLASNELVRGEAEAGFARLDQTRRIHPTSTLVLRVLAEWEATYGRLEDALLHASQALTLAPEEPPNQALMAHLLLGLGAPERARAIIDEGLAVGEEHMGVTTSHARYLLMTGRSSELRQLAGGLLEASTATPLAGKEAVLPQFWLGRLDLEEGQSRQAAERFAYILQDPDALPPLMAVELLTWGALAHRRADNEEAASSMLARAERRMTELRLAGFSHPDLSYVAATVAALHGQADRALEHLNDSIRSGWMDAWEVEHDPRLGLLHDEPQFRQMMTDVRKRNQTLLARVEEGELLAASQ